MKAIFYAFCWLLPVLSFCQQSTPATLFPADVSGASFVYHPKSESLLLIGGSSIIPDSARSDVWKWNGKTWSKIEAAGPGSRNFFPGVLNTKTGYIYSYAGMDAIGNASLKDMWSFNGKKWSRVTTTDIGTHDHHNMVYIDHLDAFLVYGGNINKYPNFDTATWILKDGNFTKLNIPGPGFRWHYGIVYDKNRKKVVMYGGGEKPDEHWEFDGAKWTKINSEVNPGRRLYHRMVYNEDAKTVIVHGGMVNQNPGDPVHNVTPTTWAWDGSTWKKIAEDPVFAMAMGYDAKRKKVVMYGKDGRSENSNFGLWELNNDKWIRIADYGKVDETGYVKKWTKEHPDDMQALTKYADIMEWQTQEFAEAAAAYKRLIKVYPQNTGMLSSLAYVLAAQGKTIEADEYLQKLNEIGGLNRDVYARLAGRLYQVKNFKEAVIYYNKLLEYAPKGNDFFRLARAYAMLGEKDKAYENLIKAIQNGYNAKKNFEDDADLAGLKSDTRFQELLSKLK